MHSLHAEDGPWGIVAWLRQRAGNGFFGELLDCFHCVSVWIALPAAIALSADWFECLFLWPALSGAAILLERITHPSPSIRPPLTTKIWSHKMSCCGQRRAQLHQQTSRTRLASEAAPLSESASSLRRGIHFRYTGRTGLTVYGPVSGHRYRFNQPGALVEVDPADATALRTVPCLRREAG